MGSLSSNRGIQMVFWEFGLVFIKLILKWKYFDIKCPYLNCIFAVDIFSNSFSPEIIWIPFDRIVAWN